MSICHESYMQTNLQNSRQANCLSHDMLRRLTIAGLLQRMVHLPIPTLYPDAGSALPYTAN